MKRRSIAWCEKSIDETESKRKPSKPSRSTQKWRLELTSRGGPSAAAATGCRQAGKRDLQEVTDDLDVLVVEDAAVGAWRDQVSA